MQHISELPDPMPGEYLDTNYKSSCHKNFKNKMIKAAPAMSMSCSHFQTNGRFSRRHFSLTLQGETEGTGVEEEIQATFLRAE